MFSSIDFRLIFSTMYWNINIVLFSLVSLEIFSSVVTFPVPQDSDNKDVNPTGAEESNNNPQTEPDNTPPQNVAPNDNTVNPPSVQDNQNKNENTASGPGGVESKTEKVAKTSRHEIITNSPTCGVGYNYNTAIHICERIIRKAHNPQQADSNNGGEVLDDRSIGADNNKERETMEWEEPQLIQLIPVECGMNYRYLKRIKICKPITLAKSSESEEQNNISTVEDDD